MTKARHLVKQLFLLLLIPVLAAAYFAGPSNASAGPRTHFSAQSVAQHPRTPCGIKHYPPCPKKHKITGQKNHHVKQGHKFHVKAQHFPAHKKITVRIVGKGRNKLIYVSHTDKSGNKQFAVEVPKNFKPGKYTLRVRIGDTVKKFTIRVEKTKKHHRGHH